MNKRFSVLFGAVLILMGALALAFNLAAPRLGLHVWRLGTYRLWPLIVLSVGLLFVAVPLLGWGERGLGAFFIPGVPVLTTGGILLFTSLFDSWGAWAWLWPLEVLAVAVGFLLAAIHMRVIWLLIPAVIVGANGLLFQFCAVTGLWGVWAALWTIEPLSVGVAFLIIGGVKRLPGLFVAGLIVCGLAGVGLVGMTGVLSAEIYWPVVWSLGIAGPAILIAVGVLLVAWSVLRRPGTPDAGGAEDVVEEPAEDVTEQDEGADQGAVEGSEDGSLFQPEGDGEQDQVD